jgi:hypothetical protein
VVLNSVDFIMWNKNKKYLLEFEEFGLRIPKTFILEEENYDEMIRILGVFHNEYKIDKIIMKGLVDANGDSLVQFDLS